MVDECLVVVYMAGQEFEACLTLVQKNIFGQRLYMSHLVHLSIDHIKLYVKELDFTILKI